MSSQGCLSTMMRSPAAGCKRDSASMAWGGAALLGELGGALGCSAVALMATFGAGVDALRLRAVDFPGAFHLSA